MCITRCYYGFQSVCNYIKYTPSVNMTCASEWIVRSSKGAYGRTGRRKCHLLCAVFQWHNKNKYANPNMDIRIIYSMQNG